MALERRLPSPLVVKFGWTACPVKAGLWPPPPAADGLDRARRPAVVCHHEIDGKLWPSQQFQTAGFRPFSDRCCAGFRMPAIDSRATFTGGRRPKAAKERTRGDSAERLPRTPLWGFE